MRGDNHLAKAAAATAAPWAVWRQALAGVARPSDDPLAAAGELVASLELLGARLYPGTPRSLDARVRRSLSILEESWHSHLAAAHPRVVPLLVLLGRGLARRPEIRRSARLRLGPLVLRACRDLRRTTGGLAALDALAWHEIESGCPAEERALHDVRLQTSSKRITALARRGRRAPILRFRLLAAASALSLSGASEDRQIARLAAAVALAAAGGRVPAPTLLEGVFLLVLARSSRPAVLNPSSAGREQMVPAGSLRATRGDLFARPRR